MISRSKPNRNKINILSGSSLPPAGSDYFLWSLWKNGSWEKPRSGENCRNPDLEKILGKTQIWGKTPTRETQEEKR